MSAPAPGSATARLVPHPDDAPAPVRDLTARVERERGVLLVTFTLDADLAALRLPAPATPRIVSGLWNHTCLEVFVAAEGTPGYHELNWAPSGAWAAFAFRAYRDGEALADVALAPGIVVWRDGNRLTLAGRVALDRLAPTGAGAPLRVALTAVIEDIHGTRTHWALRHPPGRPDFHHADGFALRLEPPGAAC